MVQTCAVESCHERYHKNSPITFHSFPKDPAKRKLWLTAIRREGFEPKFFSKVCSKHFIKQDFNTRKFGGTWLKPNAVPKLFDVSSNSTASRSLLFPADINLSDEETSSSSLSNSSSSPADERASAIEEIMTSLPSSDVSSLLDYKRASSAEESTSSTSTFKSLLTPIERNSSTEELYKSGASSLGTLSRRTSLFRLTKKYVPNELEIKDSPIAKRIKENDAKHIRYIEYLSSVKDIDDETSLSSSMRWEVAKQQKDLEGRMEVAQRERKRLTKSLISIRKKIEYMRKLNAALKSRLDGSKN